MNLWATSLETVSALLSLQVQLVPMLDVPTPQSSSLRPPLAPGGESMSHSPQNNSQNGGCPGCPRPLAAELRNV